MNYALIRYGSSNRIWWPNEAPSLITEGLPETVDIVVSHEAPLSFEPPLVRADHMCDDTWLKIVESRKYLDYVLSQVKPALWFYGHYHSHYEGNVKFTTEQRTHYHCLDIAEIVRVV